MGLIEKVQLDWEFGKPALIIADVRFGRNKITGIKISAQDFFSDFVTFLIAVRAPKDTHKEHIDVESLRESWEDTKQEVAKWFTERAMLGIKEGD